MKRMTTRTRLAGAPLAFETDAANAAKAGLLHDHSCRSLKAPEAFKVDAATRNAGQLAARLAELGATENEKDMTGLAAAIAPCAAARLGLDRQGDDDEANPMEFHCPPQQPDTDAETAPVGYRVRWERDAYADGYGDLLVADRRIDGEWQVVAAIASAHSTAAQRTAEAGLYLTLDKSWALVPIGTN